MKSELSSVHLCVLANKWGLGLLSVHQDSRADPFGSWSMVALLGLREHAGSKTYTDMFKLKKYK